MKIVETNRRLMRNSNGAETVENIWADLFNGDAKIGTLTVNPGNAAISINVYGFSDMEEGLTKAAEVLGAEIEQEGGAE